MKGKAMRSGFVAILLAATAASMPSAARGQVSSSSSTATVVDTFQLAVGPAARLDLHTIKGDVHVRTWNRDMLQIIARHPRASSVRIDHDGSVVGVQLERGHGQPVDFTISAPVGMDLDIQGVETDVIVENTQGRLDIETVHGAIDVRGGRSAIHLSSVQGSVSLSGARGRVDLSTVNQSITATDIVGDLEAETVNGGIRLTGVEARNVEASTVNGGIVYDGTLASDGWYRFNSHNGGIELVVPEGTDANVRVSTFNGDLKPGFQILVTRARGSKQFEFVLGSGGARIEMESFNGTIRLLRPGQR